LLWLPAAVSAVLVPAVFVLGMRTDPPSVRAGAEPVMAGIVLAAPFFLLFLLDVLGALHARISESRRGRRTALAVVTVAALALTTLLVGVVAPAAARDGSPGTVVGTVLLALALLASVVPAWVSHRQENKVRAPAR